MPGFEIFGDEERIEVQDVLDTGILFRYGFDQARKGHWKAKTFEAELAKRVGAGYCLLCSSGTAALNIALASCGVGAGDEVIVPPFTFIATIEAVLNAGAVPVFAEIDDTLCLDPGAVEAVISPRTKAVLTVHMCGSMARIDEIRMLCDQKGLILIEDACQAVGGSFQGKSLGTFGRMGCFSFDAVKTITCGEGGGVVTNDKSLYLKADAYADHGHDHIGDDRGLEGHANLGMNFRISELNAAVGLAQLRKLDLMLEKQRSHKKAIKAALADIPGISFRKIPDKKGDSATFLSFFLPDASVTRKIAHDLGQAGVDGCFYWYENNWHYIRQWDHLKKLQTSARLAIQLLENCPDYQQLNLPQSDGIMSRTISMLIKLSWTEQELVQRIDKMTEVIKA
ncbi:DegT/DnrJ/EryC1/StrS family aminotransferase [Desulfonema magnum]|uniref:DegT/DnrJ/EryC1/StrS aminotransferase domain-containing protein n=1 Tax=Desulfonema magnum TaxID=45655 RepID=A0A975BRT3_9BACT|nr:DegT/DnrJ/EryC1/StrS family aminotransferase [Desulfonema magnum]QTA90456.1 DegT/DnrJ/EryC1/StrS aminotransferase domain-containing protein [Desulfonema magnum]